MSLTRWIPIALAPVVLALAAPCVAAAQVTLPGTRAPALAAATDDGPVADTAPVAGTRLLLHRPAELRTRLDQLIEAQQDPGSPLYHRWLTPIELGHDFGPTSASVAAAENWLSARGLTVVSVSPTRTAITFSGTARTVGRAFAAPLHAYTLHGRHLNAFAADPAIPAALSGIVAGVAGLSGDRPEPQLRPLGPVVRTATGWHRRSAITSAPGPASGTALAPDFDTTIDGTAQQDVTPADFATIYNLNPLRTGSSVDLGAGQTIAVVEDSDIQSADWTTFRSTFGLSSYPGTLTTIHPGGCADPSTNADEAEAALDAEWSSAVAPAASIELASCSDATGGVQAALEGLVNASSHPNVISVSFGECESALGATAVQAWANVLEEGAAEGISIFVSTGDSGSAGCDQDAAIASHGLAVNGLASSAYDVAVGGTDFADLATNTVATYWSATNGATDGSARSYIPEIPWNDTCANPILANFEGTTPLAFCNSAAGQDYLPTGGGGGGRSTLFAKPSYQSGVYGIPNDAARDLPDVVLFAADGVFGHALLYCMSDRREGGTACTYANGAAVEASSAGGTSFSAPAFAGIQALIDARKGGAQGNPNPRLYALSVNQGATLGGGCNASYGTNQPAACVFHDVAEGSNDQACRSGTTSCYTGGGTDGVLSVSTRTDSNSYPSVVGYDLSTGLGSVNIANLVASY